MSTSNVEDRLRAMLRATVREDRAAGEVDDGLVDLRNRLLGEAPAPVALDRARGRRRRAVALAAAAVVAVLVVAAVALRGGDGGSDQVRTVDPPPEGAPATGWYVPEGLGDEWELESVVADFRDVEGFGGACPCTSRLWLAPDGDASLFVGSSIATGPLDVGDLTDPVEVELGGGVVATAGTISFGQPGPRVLVWNADGVRWFLSGPGLGADDQDRAARAVASSPDLAEAPAPLDGFEPAALVEAPAIVDYQAVAVTMRRPRDGIGVTYVLTPPGFGESGEPYALSVVRTLPGRPGPVIAAPMGDGDAGSLIALWPGADVVANGDGGFGSPTSPGDSEVAMSVLGALQPVDGAAWSTFLDTATGEVEPIVRADELLDLATPTG